MRRRRPCRNRSERRTVCAAVLSISGVQSSGHYAFASRRPGSPRGNRWRSESIRRAPVARSGPLTRPPPHVLPEVPMSVPDRHNPYDFAPYLAWRESVDYYRDDPFLQALVRASAGPRADAVDTAARELSPRASQRWRLLADASALPERRPQLVHWD